MPASTSITDVSATLPPLEEVLDVFTLSAGLNSSVVVLGTFFLGIAAGIVGSFTLLRRRALMGDALAHSTLPGVCLAFMVLVAISAGRSLPVLLAGAAVSGVIGVIVVHLLTRGTRLREDAAIGVVLSVFFGFGVLLLSIIQSLGSGGEGGLHSFIYGQTAAMSTADAQVTALLAIMAIAAALLLLKEFRVVCFDPAFARVQGWPVTLIDFLLMALVVLVTVTGLQSVGLILVIALLVIPPAAARFWTEKLKVMTILSAIIGGLSGYLGACLSALLPRMPAGAVIVLTSGLVFFLSFLFAPARGVIASAVRLFKLRIKISSDHILRTIYELLELKGEHLKDESVILFADARQIAKQTGGLGPLTLKTLIWTKKLKIHSNKVGVVLTSKGLAETKLLVRNHRLWEEYVLRFGQLATSHVDYSADLVEHVLSPEIVQQLEKTLSEKGTAIDSDLNSIHSLTLSAAGET